MRSALQMSFLGVFKNCASDGQMSCIACRQPVMVVCMLANSAAEHMEQNRHLAYALQVRR
jgi:hypothetical protein